MTFVTTDCPGCGEAEIPLESVTLRVCDDDDSVRCAIRCTHCGSRFSKSVDDGMSVLLVTFGVTVENWSRPAEVDERPLHHAPISYEELEAFADALAAADDVMPFVLDAG
jgi:transcriptional regulator NrdR family protein